MYDSYEIFPFLLKSQKHFFSGKWDFVQVKVLIPVSYHAIHDEIEIFINFEGVLSLMHDGEGEIIALV